MQNTTTTPSGYGARRKFPLTPIRVLAPGSLHPRPSAWPPIDMSEKFLVHVSAGRNLLAIYWYSVGRNW